MITIFPYRFILLEKGNIVKLLQEKGVDLNVRDDAGRTPLHDASSNGKE